MPPVVAPLEKISPAARPSRAPPHTAASMGSVAGKGKSRFSPSMATEDRAMAYREEASRCPPMNRHPSRNRGMFTSRTNRPTDRKGI